MWVKQAFKAKFLWARFGVRSDTLVYVGGADCTLWRRFEIFEISMSPFWSAIRHASVRRRRRLHAVKTFKVGGHHFASLSDKADQSSGVGDSRNK